MKLENICNQIYVVALNEARMQGHEYLTPEHFLYASLMFDHGKEIVSKSGGDIIAIQNELIEFFKTKLPHKPSDSPTDSFEFIKMFELATAQARGLGTGLVHLGNILAAILNLPESFASYFLQKNGVDRRAVIRYASTPVVSQGQAAPDEPKAANAAVGKSNDEDVLERFTVNMVEKAGQGEYDPLIAREDALSRTIQVLSRRLKNNPVHVGEPGVGKTAIVEGLASRIAVGDVPAGLRGSLIFYIDMGTLLAGTKYRGDFEERLIKVVEAISRHESPIVYIDEIHTVVGAGAVGSGALDAGSILKPYLTRGRIRFIGATTYEEYKKHFEKDRALSRRFQKIDIPEPNMDESIEILMGLRQKYEAYHNVSYSDDIIRMTCELSIRHMPERFMPDKAIDVLDETGAHIRIIRTDDDQVEVRAADIERTVALMARIPEKSISGSEADKLMYLEDNIRKELFGQDDAVSTVVSAIKASRSGLNDGEKCVANLLFVGPTGVGKTEIAKLLTKHLGLKLLRYDMSEYQEKHSVARLIGSPPGYVGYEEGGLLTEAIRRSPHAVLLLDEIEKAHPDIFNVLLQIMDYGALTDNSGKKADFRNIILIMTSNAGAKELGKRIIGYGGLSGGSEAIDKAVERIFSPEFRNRLDATVQFKKIDAKMAGLIAEKSVGKLSERLADKNITIQLSDSALKYIAGKGFSEEYGAREIIRTVEREIKSQLIDKVLFGNLQGGGKVMVDYKNGKLVISSRKTYAKRGKANAKRGEPS
ncbi:MAG: ATP-dependent Clp protease ATP-binding subunit [Defluviitaleaceae bacterium]|nr:ATP-dependent Clp protease ATP-binding subunit [Defluviitaleaceae bacterium]